MYRISQAMLSVVDFLIAGSCCLVAFLQCSALVPVRFSGADRGTAGGGTDTLTGCLKSASGAKSGRAQGGSATTLELKSSLKRFCSNVGAT